MSGNMSSKASKKTVTTTTSTSSSSTMSGGTSQAGASGTRASTSRQSATPTPSTPVNVSQLSPTKYTRLHEKAELANLNDRLACYIDRVRHLEVENSRLTREVTSSQETITREVTSVKSMYEAELTEARKLLDELSREKAKLEIDTRRIFEEKDDIKSNLEKKTKEASILQSNLSLSESRLNDVTGKYNQAQQEKKKLAEENKSLEKERNKLANQLADTKRFLEEETLHRVDLENAIQSVKEELAFKSQMYEQQITEVRTKRQSEISEIDGKLSQEYEEKLYQSLQDIRDQYEVDLKNNRDEIKLLYEEKIRSLASQLTRNSNAASMAIEEMRQMQSRTENVNIKVVELESELNGKNLRVRELEKMLENERSRYITEISKLDEELTRLREEMARQVQDYQELMDIKVALDLEISAYRKLLEGEEARLNITPVSSPATRQSPRSKGTGSRAGKRKRTFLDESEESSDFSVSTSAKGDIELTDACPEGKFIKVHNKGAKEQSLSGWQLVRRAGDATTTFKFHRSIKIEPGHTVTVWSGDQTQQTHEPPENLVMKGQKWVVANHMTTVLLNSAGDEMSTTEHKKQIISMSSLRQTRESSGFFQRRPPLSTELYQQGDLQGEERCSIM